jgi:diguanylate cyclase (GGDEF)-like protein
LDAGTLSTVLFIVCAVVAGLLTVTWLQNQSVPAFGAWTISFALCAAASAMLLFRGSLPGFLAVDAASALRFLAFGVALQAARQFTGRKENWTIALAPGFMWFATAALFGFGGDLHTRVLIASPLVAAYAFALAHDLWLASPRARWISRLAAVLLIIHGATFAARFAFVVLSPDVLSATGAGPGGPFHPIAILEAIVIMVALAFLLLTAAKDEIGLQHRDAALMDSLTGVPNRRAFEAEAKRILLRAARERTSTALLLLDLDHFKSVNDTFGHAVGDRALQSFAKTVTEQLRGGDVLGRLGGEEFAVALAGNRVDQAAILAERIRRAVAGVPIPVAQSTISLTVSIGVAAVRGSAQLETLLARADVALYRAKAGGRNRVELAAAPVIESEDLPPAPLAAESRAA